MECIQNVVRIKHYCPGAAQLKSGEPSFHWVIYDAVPKPLAIAVIVTNKVKKIRLSFNIEIPDYPVKRT